MKAKIIRCDVCDQPTSFKTDLAKHLGVNYLCEDCYKENKQDFFFCYECKQFFKIEDVTKEHPVTVDVLEEYELEDEFMCEECANKFNKYLYDIVKSGVLEALDIEDEEYNFNDHDYYY